MRSLLDFIYEHENYPRFKFHREGNIIKLKNRTNETFHPFVDRRMEVKLNNVELKKFIEKYERVK
jgi:hypothetical protein